MFFTCSYENVFAALSCLSNLRFQGYKCTLPITKGFQLVKFLGQGHTNKKLLAIMFCKIAFVLVLVVCYSLAQQDSTGFTQDINPILHGLLKIR